MSSRVTDVLRRCRDEHRAALVGYLPVGYPDVDRSIEAMVAMVEAGVDIVEVGIPYSDPVMDGTTSIASSWSLPRPPPSAWRPPPPPAGASSTSPPSWASPVRGRPSGPRRPT